MKLMKTMMVMKKKAAMKRGAKKAAAHSTHKGPEGHAVSAVSVISGFC
jgi:hypothetical protein